MKKILIILIIILPILSYGQFSKDYKVSTGTPYEVIDAYDKYYYNEGDDIMMIKKFKKKIIIQRYNTQEGKEVSKREYKDVDFERIVKLKDTYYMISEILDENKKNHKIYYRIINFEDGTIGEENEFASFENDIIKTNYLSSYDKSKFLVKHIKKRKSRNDKLSTDIYDIKVFNSNLEEIWSKNEVEMPFTEAQMNNRDYAIDGNGVLYMLIEVFDSDISHKFVKGKKNYHLELLRINEDGIERTQLDRDDYFINTIRLFESARKKMYLMGYYSEKVSPYPNVEGTFIIALNDTGEVENSQYYKIPLEVINMYEKKGTRKRNAKKDKKGKLSFENLVFDNIYSQEDGSFLLIGEQYYVTSDPISQGGHTYIHHTDNILAVKFNADGELKWMKKLPKRQKSSLGRQKSINKGKRLTWKDVFSGEQLKILKVGGISYAHVFKNGNHYFFYIDRIENLDLPLDKMPKTIGNANINGILSAFKINDSTGEVSKDFIFDMRKVKIKGEKKPSRVYQFDIDRIQETPSGISIEVYKKDKEDVMINVSF